MAAIYDAIQVGNWQRVRGRRSKMPKPLRRPGQTEKAAVGSGTVGKAELARRFGYRKTKRGG